MSLNIINSRLQSPDLGNLLDDFPCFYVTVFSMSLLFLVSSNRFLKFRVKCFLEITSFLPLSCLLFWAIFTVCSAIQFALFYIEGNLISHASSKYLWFNSTVPLVHYQWVQDIKAALMFSLITVGISQDCIDSWLTLFTICSFPLVRFFKSSLYYLL